MDLLPGFAAQVDFGIQPSKDPTRVFGALQNGLKAERFTQQELNAASCNGEALTALVNRGTNPYGKGLTITTTWDDMPEEDEFFEEQEDMRAHALSDRQEK